MPERYAQVALGHASKSVHRAYARGAVVTVPSLETYEEKAQNIVSFPSPLLPEGEKCAGDEAMLALALTLPLDQALNNPGINGLSAFCSSG